MLFEGTIMSDWNAAHRALLRSRMGTAREITTVTDEVEELRNEIAEKLNRIDTLKKNIAEVEAAISAGGFTPPDGFDIWGDPLEPKVRLLSTAPATKKQAAPMLPPTGSIIR